jgi:hypothetical protein
MAKALGLASSTVSGYERAVAGPEETDSKTMKLHRDPPMDYVKKVASHFKLSDQDRFDLVCSAISSSEKLELDLGKLYLLPREYLVKLFACLVLADSAVYDISKVETGRLAVSYGDKKNYFPYIKDAWRYAKRVIDYLAELHKNTPQADIRNWEQWKPHD